MKSLLQIGLSCLFLFQSSLIGFAQSGIITTFIAPRQPVDGAKANTIAIEGPGPVAADKAGGFYVVDQKQHQVHRVSADGMLKIVAGNGTDGFSGDGGPATAAQLNCPWNITVDSAGNLFVVDYLNIRIRKVTPTGIISTVAGTGNKGFSGDGGPATAARMENPNGIAVDSAGNLFIADMGNQRIRKVTSNGIISTVAGNGTPGFNGDGQPAVSAQLHSPSSIAVDNAGNLFINDRSNHRIRKVTPAGIINTVADTAKFGFNGNKREINDLVSGIAVDDSNNLFISANQRIWLMTPKGIISTVAGNGAYGFSGDGGPAISAQLWYPNFVAVDTNGNLFITDSYNNRIRKVTPAGIINTVAGTGTYGFDGLALDVAGNLFIVDGNNSWVLKATPTGIISNIAGNGTDGFSGDNGLAISAQLSGPMGIAVDSAENIYIADTGNHRIRKVTPTGTISTIVGNGEEGFGGDGKPAISAQLNRPWSVAVDAIGNLYISDTFNHRIRKVTPDGIINTIAGNGHDRFSQNDFGRDGMSATSVALDPLGIAVDTAGNVYIADGDNFRIRKLSPDGILSTVAGTGVGSTSEYKDWTSGDYGPATSAQLNFPFNIAIDDLENLYIADYYYGRVRKVTRDGIINTIVGNGTEGFSGDGGPAAAAQLFQPKGMTVDAAGNLYIADYGNRRIRKVIPSKPPNMPR